MEPKTRRVRRRDCIRLDKDDRTYFTNEGYLVDHPIVTSCGIFEYVNPDGSVRRELRLPEHVFAEQSLKTYKGKPIIITHDAGVVNKENVDKEQIGTILSEGYQDGDDVRAEIIIHNTDAMKDCGLKELSLGYNLDLIEEPGTWKGEPYDAIQTNITINHLALVASARAGEQARLNIDGSDEPELKGGKVMSKPVTKKKRADEGIDLTPEELQEAIAQYKANKASEEPASDGDDETIADPAATDPATEETAADEGEDTTATPEDTLATVKENCEKRDSEDPDDVEGAKEIIAQQDSDIQSLIAALEQVLAELKGNADEEDPVQEEENADGGEEDPEGENSDGSDDESQGMNADSVDKIVSEKLAICLVGNRLHLDGLEKMSILAAKKAIIKKVMPTMRMDGKSTEYINAMYDMAVAQASQPKGVGYQRQQMTAGRKPIRKDSSQNVSMAASARQRMISRTEGGK